jgi:hypothetical protein
MTVIHFIFKGFECLLILFAISFCVAAFAGMFIGAGGLNREVDRHWDDDLP